MSSISEPIGEFVPKGWRFFWSVFVLCCAVISSLVVYIFKGIAGDIADIQIKIEGLNVKVAMMETRAARKSKAQDMMAAELLEIIKRVSAYKCPNTIVRGDNSQ